MCLKEEPWEGLYWQLGGSKGLLSRWGCLVTGNHTNIYPGGERLREAARGQQKQQLLSPIKTCVQENPCLCSDITTTGPGLCLSPPSQNATSDDGQAVSIHRPVRNQCWLPTAELWSDFFTSTTPGFLGLPVHSTKGQTNRANILRYLTSYISPRTLEAQG